MKDSVWLLWITYDVDYPFTKRTVLDGIYASDAACLIRIDQIKTDPYAIHYHFEERQIII
jgi:hypothetical protein